MIVHSILDSKFKKQVDTRRLLKTEFSSVSYNSLNFFSDIYYNLAIVAFIRI